MAFLRIVLFLVLSLAGSGYAVAQQSTAIQPCTEASASSKSKANAKKAGKKLSTIVKATVSQTAIDETLPDDAAVQKIIAPYAVKVRELETVIGKLEGELRKGGVGGGSLGNFVADGLRAVASRELGHYVPLMITNSGGLRKNSITAGELRTADIFELLPFENALIEIELSGEQLRKLLTAAVKRGDAQSGARIHYRLNEQKDPEIVSVNLVGEEGTEVAIDSNKTYRLVTIDYLLQLKSGSYAILQEGKNVTPIGITMRDALLEYVKSETGAGRTIKPALDGRFVPVEQETVKPEVRP
jgi:2',3'-cyclic-nucleotide 2'-phosphodiesterase (5'-nucleotidase family)